LELVQTREMETSVSELTSKVLAGCVAVHRELGPGLSKLAYEECLCYELAEQGVRFTRRQPVPVVYKGLSLSLGYQVDLVVENTLIVEVMTIERLLPIHDAQLLSYMKLTGLPAGLLLNFAAPVFRYRVRHLAHGT
jgi:GxxExxY protein